MYCITDEQIEYILNDIRRNGVEMEDLQLNLLDHICCIIEQQLKENDDFERFYHEIIKQFYKKDLHEIEVETINLLTFKNYYAMKKLMIGSGMFSAIAFIIGSFFKIMYWPGANVLLFLAIMILSFIFLPVTFLLKTKETTWQQNKWILSIGTLVAIMYSLSTLFLVMHWPGSRVLWLSTLSISFFVLVPLFFFTGIRKAETKVNTIVATVLLMGFLGLQFTLTAIRPSSEMQGRVYTYLQTEALLQQSVNRKSTDSNKLVQDIQAKCQQIKDLILEREVGMKAIPLDFDTKGMRIPEKNLATFFAHGEGYNLLHDLKMKVNTYNTSKGSAGRQIPIENSILQPGFTDKNFFSSFFVLNNVAQIQLFLANVNDDTDTIAMTSE